MFAEIGSSSPWPYIDNWCINIYRFLSSLNAYQCEVCWWVFPLYWWLTVICSSLFSLSDCLSALSPKVLSSLGHHGSGSSSSSPAGNGFITKEMFGANVPSRTTPVKTPMKTRRDGALHDDVMEVVTVEVMKQMCPLGFFVKVIEFWLICVWISG